MQALRIALAPSLFAGLFAAGCAQAQLLPVAPLRLSTQPPSSLSLLTPSPYSDPFYALNDVERPEPDYVNRMRSDPRFKVGINLNRYLALESGYLERIDRGWHSVDVIDPLDPDGTDAAGGLGARGFHTYAGAKVTLPLTDKLSAFGMLGLNHSERRGRMQNGKHEEDTDTGAFSRFGAEYKVSARTTLDVEGQRFGNTAKKWGEGPAGTNANWIKAALKVGL
jgi:hypothetical protein